MVNSPAQPGAQPVVVLLYILYPDRPPLYYRRLWEMSTYLFYLFTEIILDFNPIISYIKSMKEFYITFGCGFAVAIWLVAVVYSLSFIGLIWLINTGFNVHCVIAYQSQTNGQRKFKEFALIVDSIWFLPIMAIVGLAIIYWFDQTWALIHWPTDVTISFVADHRWIWGQVDTYVGNLSARNYLAKLEPRSQIHSGRSRNSLGSGVKWPLLIDGWIEVTGPL